MALFCSSCVLPTVVFEVVVSVFHFDGSCCSARRFVVQPAEVSQRCVATLTCPPFLVIPVATSLGTPEAMRVTTWLTIHLLEISVLLPYFEVVAYVRPAFLYKCRAATKVRFGWQHRLVVQAKKIPISPDKNEITQSNKSNGFGAGATVTKSKKNDLQGKLRSVSSTARVGAGSKQLRQAALTFDRIRKEHGKEFSNDVYVRSPLNSTSTFWFVGKVAYEPTVIPTIQDEQSMVDAGVLACISQKRLILEYSMHHLRPQNMGGTYASALEIWLAPADSEMDVAQNKVTLRPVLGSARTTLPEHFKADSVGYNPEIYVGDEITQGGLRVLRDEDGKPIKPVFEVNQTV